MRDPKLFTQILAKYNIFLHSPECIDINLMHCKYRLRLSCQGIMQNFQLVRARYAKNLLRFLVQAASVTRSKGNSKNRFQLTTRWAQVLRWLKLSGKHRLCVSKILSHASWKMDFFVPIFVRAIATASFCVYLSHAHRTRMYKLFRKTERIPALNNIYRDEW